VATKFSHIFSRRQTCQGVKDFRRFGNYLSPYSGGRSHFLKRL